MVQLKIIKEGILCLFIGSLNFAVQLSKYLKVEAHWIFVIRLYCFPDPDEIGHIHSRWPEEIVH